MGNADFRGYVPPGVDDSPENIQARIKELEAVVVMKAPNKPEENATPEQITEYRGQMAMRHLKERLSKQYNIYSAGNLENLYEIMMTMTDSNHPDFKKLYDEVVQKLVAGGAQVDGWLTGVKEEQLKEIADIFAASNVPIQEETSKEKKLHAQDIPEFKKYIARDATVDGQIADLRKQLSN